MTSGVDEPRTKATGLASALLLRACGLLVAAALPIARSTTAFVVCVTAAGCSRPEAPVPYVWRNELADLPGVWRVGSVTEPPHRAWREAVSTDPDSPLWRQIPEGSGDEAMVCAHSLPSGATVRGVLMGEGLAETKVSFRLLGMRENEFWPFWAWHPESDEARVEFTAVVPAGGEWVGGVITMNGPNPGGTRLRVESLVLEDTRIPPPTPNLILITLDTFRADYLSCVNDDASPTPTLDSLASTGVLFEHAVSTSQCTGPSHASMLTGLYCLAHGVYRNNEGLSSDAVTLAEVLSECGYRTMGAVSIAHLNPTTSNLGQGFDTFIESTSRDVGGEPAGLQTVRVIRSLRLVPWDSRPLFLWIHYFDPHTPYTPPAEYAEGCAVPGSLPPVRYLDGMGAVAYDPETGLVRDPAGEVARYCGEVRFLDAQLRGLLDGLRRLGLMEHTVLMVVADHGESLGEHGIYFEHAGMFEEVLRVPLVVSGVGIPQGVRVTTRVSGVDVFTTLLARAGVRRIPANYGRDLVPVAEGTPPKRDAVFAESVNGSICAAWKGNLKAVWVPDGMPHDWSIPECAMLFDLADDPQESVNLSLTQPTPLADLRRAFEKAKIRPLVSLQADQGVVDRDRLRALGYAQ